MHLIGDVKGRDAIVNRRHDRHGRTLIQAVTAVEREAPAAFWRAGSSGPVRTGDERIKGRRSRRSWSRTRSGRRRQALASRITVLTVAPLLGEAIRRIHDEESVSTLFA